MDSLIDILASRANEYANKNAIIAVDVDNGKTKNISYGELFYLVGRTAAFLNAHGIHSGDRVAILMHNCAETLIIELAAGILGAATVPLDSTRDTQERKIFKLKDTKTKLLLFKKDVDPVETADFATCSWSSFAEFVALLPQKPFTPKQATSLSETYLILYTSGTTALPKGTILSQRACLMNARGICAWQKFTLDDRFNIVLPLHHINSTEFCLAMILSGGTIILNNRYSASKFWQIISKYKATNTSIVPTILHDLLGRERKFSKKKIFLKRICIGSAPVLPEETFRFYKTFGIRVVQGYGQTETALRVAGVPVDVDKKTYMKFVKSNTIGTQLKNNTLAIMDHNNNEKKEGDQGEICIAGPVLADGYLNNVEETAKAFKNGWFHSGDLGYWKMIDNQKFYFIIGRLKEIIIKGGVNISPSAIEDALIKAFANISQVSVVGYPDSRMGEEIAAVIVSKKHFTFTNVPTLSRYEMPSKIFFVDELPKTSTGKIQRVEIKKMVAAWIKNDTRKNYFIRQIKSTDIDNLTHAVLINNDRWTGLPATLLEFTSRAKNGLLFGVFENTEGLVGTLSCVRLDSKAIPRSWEQATKNGTLVNFNPKGDTLLCVAISVKNSSSVTPLPSESPPQQKAKKKIADYVAQGKDHVLAFHAKPKGGLKGATVWKILENGRRDDKESMGYNVLMRYPLINKNTKIILTKKATPAVMLIEHALMYSKEHGIKHVVAFSRPSGFRQYLLSTQG